jgi:2-polyprenyl-6-methoxyphenol hydroxylase-like FAD-dependent oxidoreductase
VLSIELLTDIDPVNIEKSVSRMTLRQVLLTGLEDIVHFDKKFTLFEQDDTSITGDILVGAEGSNSQVRKHFLPYALLGNHHCRGQASAYL